MDLKNLDISSLEKAIIQLENSLSYYHSEMVQRDAGLTLQLKAAAIQAFEFTYELSWKMLKRYLEISSPSAESIDAMPFPDLIRTASEQALLLGDWSDWKRYREARNITSYTYDQKKATQVMAIIPKFLEEAQYLAKQLGMRIDGL